MVFEAVSFRKTPNFPRLLMQINPGRARACDYCITVQGKGVKGILSPLLEQSAFSVRYPRFPTAFGMWIMLSL
jgi:hypothetical protein